MSLQAVQFKWSQIAYLTQSVVPPLDSSNHKGSSGRIGVIGGSTDHCGAPYYAAMSALKAGADLAWVYSSLASSGPIKSFSPDLIVIPFYDDNVILPLDNIATPQYFTEEVCPM